MPGKTPPARPAASTENLRRALPFAASCAMIKMPSSVLPRASRKHPMEKRGRKAWIGISLPAAALIAPHAQTTDRRPVPAQTDAVAGGRRLHARGLLPRKGDLPLRGLRGLPLRRHGGVLSGIREPPGSLSADGGHASGRERVKNPRRGSMIGSRLGFFKDETGIGICRAAP